MKCRTNLLTWLFIALVITAGIYLVIKATHENSWDGWGFGSAQTMMSIKYWVKDGWANHYFLFISTGYSKITRYFDDPKLNQHAWVDVTGSPGQKRIYYTHFPSGYSFPLAFLMELGFKNRFWFRFFQILLSLTSLLLLYKFFGLIANRTIAFSAALFYMLSVPFLNFADSLANMVIDDFLRFLILFLSVLALNNIGDAKKYRIYNFWIWLTYFILASSSYDSTFFIFTWLVGLNIITRWHLLKENAEPRSKWLKAILVRGLVFASAPILAFIVQMIQNASYLGLHGMLSDFSNAFSKISLSKGAGQGFFQSHFLQGVLYPITEAFAFPFRTRYLLIFLVAPATAWLILRKNKKTAAPVSSVEKYLFLFAFAAFSQTLVILDNHPYKGRVLGVFAALLIGTFIFLLIGSANWRTKPVPKILVCLVAPMTIFIIFLQAQRTLTYIRQWPNNVYDPKIIEFAKELKNAVRPFHLADTVIFSMFQPKPYSYGNEFITDGMAIYYDMYYHDVPIVNFSNVPEMIRDFLYLKQVSAYPFSGLMLFKAQGQMDAALGLLQKNQPVLAKESIKTFIIEDKYVLLIF